MGRWFFVLFSVFGLVVSASAAVPEVVLEYHGRYLSQGGEPDHLLDAIALADGRVVVAGNRGLALLSAQQLPFDGTRSYLDRLTGLDARNLYRAGDGWLFVNLSRRDGESSAGFAVVRVDGDKLVSVTRVEETGVLYEKMFVDGDRLWVAAHEFGLRVFDISDPAAPLLIGALEAGFTDAWAVAAEGDRVFVADGGSGLKVIDASDLTDLRILASETVDSALGTAEDVSVRGGEVYLAAGGAGVVVYDATDIGSRTTVEVGGAAKDLAWIGERLAVATMSGVAVLEPDGSGSAVVVGGESTSRRNNGTLRICSAVGAWGEDRVLLADWNFVDAYRLVSGGESTQPDIVCDLQRVRFAPGGGRVTAAISNAGGAPLSISGWRCSSPAFDCDLEPTVLDPGESMEVALSYDGSTFATSAVLGILSNDPDEDPLPIQVFGATTYLDPGEEMPDFELEGLIRDPVTGVLGSHRFRLSEHRGKVVWFQVYGTW